MYAFLLPVLRLSTDVTQEAHVYLYEDGLYLWHVTLQSAPAITTELLELYNNMPALLDQGGEMLQECLKVIESYVILAPNEFLEVTSYICQRGISNILLLRIC